MGGPEEAEIRRNLVANTVVVNTTNLEQWY